MQPERTRIVVWLWVASAWLAIHCTGALAAQGPSGNAAGAYSGRLLVTGSSTMAPMIVEIGRRFAALHRDVRIVVQTGGSGRGISDVIHGKADIGMASRALTAQESSLYSFAIARDGICLVVHKNNTVQKLDNRQVAGIYGGALTNWKKVGGRDAAIAVMNAREGYASVELFTHYFNIRYTDIKAHAVLGDNSERLQAVIGNPDAIAYTSVGSAQRQAAQGAAIRLLPVEGVAATQKNIRSGNFPLSRPLLLLTKEPPVGLRREFINFSLSSQATEVVVQHDFVPYLD
ncbi:MAG: phosphate ABC transporter substrate-binding protein [Betaproteobacteria bacterium]|nr:phosphate ABC transporter substrate-binding protein [Betaproteobacteria bacterium]